VPEVFKTALGWVIVVTTGFFVAVVPSGTVSVAVVWSGPVVTEVAIFTLATTAPRALPAGGAVVVEVQTSLVFPVVTVQPHPAAEGVPVNVSPVGRVTVRTGAPTPAPADAVSDGVRVSV
jgi:hypothetical protein